jgi:hypothetical protein
MRYKRDWARVTRKLNEGGHLYISSEVLDMALDFGGIPVDSKLKVRAWAMKDSRHKGVAKVILKFKVYQEGEDLDA